MKVNNWKKSFFIGLILALLFLVYCFLVDYSGAEGHPPATFYGIVLFLPILLGGTLLTQFFVKLKEEGLNSKYGILFYILALIFLLFLLRSIL